MNKEEQILKFKRLIDYTDGVIFALESLLEDTEDKLKFSRKNNQNYKEILGRLEQ